MFDWISGHREPEGGRDQGYFGSLSALYAQAESVSFDVAEIENSLLDSYSKEGLVNISRRFEGISKNFTNYTIIQHNPFYEIVHKSNARLIAVKNVAKEAKNIAQLFERYSKTPKSFSASNSRIQINRLQAELENLKAYCSSGGLD
jgi:hypothetical protein